jgi:hypothetical protein
MSAIHTVAAPVTRLYHPLSRLNSTLELLRARGSHTPLTHLGEELADRKFKTHGRTPLSDSFVRDGLFNILYQAIHAGRDADPFSCFMQL